MSSLPSKVTLLRAIDSHTGGEPTRVIVDGAPSLPGYTMAEKREALRHQADWIRTASVLEPRGHEAMVGAMLFPPTDPSCAAGVVFFNNADYLNGCLHGTMGLAVTLRHLGLVGPGQHRIETPVGMVTIDIQEGGRVAVRNVRSYRREKDVTVKVPGFGSVTGDIAWGGNWFFLTEYSAGLSVTPENIAELTALSRAIRNALREHHPEVDHVEIFGPSTHAGSRNFVLCPGNAYDRSPCGTGTSAKLACLYEDGVLRPGEVWRQAGILDTVFEGTVEPAPEGGVIPQVTGIAFITAETTLLVDPAAPFAFGIPALLASES